MVKCVLKSAACLLAVLSLTTSLDTTVNSAYLGTVSVYVGGMRIDRDGISYIEDGTAYVPLRELCETLGAQVKWNREEGSVTVSAPGISMTICQKYDYFETNGRYFYAEGGFPIKNGKLMVPVRAVAEALGVKIQWDQASSAVKVGGLTEPIVSGDEYYSDEDVYWLSRLIFAEAGGESLEGKIAVGNVVMNRVKDPAFPDTVKDVIFDNRYGIQFSPAYSGAIYNEPTKECVVAAKIALEGTQVVGNCLYFTAAWVETSWAERNREFYGQIGGQVFFL